MKGELFGHSGMEILAARVRVSAHNVFFLAVYPASRANTHRLAATRLFEQAQVSIDGTVVTGLRATTGKAGPQIRK